VTAPLSTAVLALIAAAGAIGAVFAVLMLAQRSLYASAICLLVTLTQVGAIFYLLGFQLLAFLQVLIYAGAVMVLLVEAVMAAPPRLEDRFSRLSVPKPIAAAAPLALLLELVAWGVLGAPAQAVPTISAPQSAKLAAILFGRFAPLTEAVGLLILLAALAVVETSKPGYQE
jgi:NADH:ubiquinone oxidoreductase subunit 6 (subunit J)